MSPRQVVGLVLAVLALIFVFQNNDDVSIQLLNVEVVAPMWITTLVLLAIGILVGWLLTTRRARSRK